MKTNIDTKNIKLPQVQRDGNLISRLLAIVIVGFDLVLDEKSRLYLRLLTRLIDKSYDEYDLARTCLIEEIKTGDKLALRFEIINHFENCIGAASRVSKLINLTLNGVSIQKKAGDKIIHKEKLDIIKLFDQLQLKTLMSKNLSDVRNRVEHIDEDIYTDKFSKELFLDIDSKYKTISINNISIKLTELAQMIEDYHKLMLGIFSRLPNRMEYGKYYHNKQEWNLT
ncbi:MAG: hypothetical protein A2776_00645 [Candidatus Levybacteria bacterium RIFCSPHIGHO2_01_FULL_40_10]|nr:MAG: hypothetical protein A2776_00645 [Candidatus Levybacteria bacterium RIFCSPHIGHO2_01_FULL_40_10]